MEYVEKINDLSRFIKEILNIAFENNQYVFSETDKKVLYSFKEKIFEIAMDNFENVSNFQEILKLIIKIHMFSLKGRKTSTDYIDNLFPKEYINRSFEKHIENKYFSKEKLDIEDINNLDNILILLINENSVITSIIEKSIKLLENNNINIYNMKFMKIFIQRFTEGRFLIQDSLSEKSFQLAYNFLNSETQKKDFNLFFNQEVLDILQMINRIPEEKSKNFLNIIHKNLELDKVDISKVNEKIKKYVQSHSDNVIVDEEEFDEFLKELQTLKLMKNDTIDMEIIRLILFQFFNKNSVIYNNKDKYFVVIQRIIEEISINDLKANGINGNCLFRSEFGQKTSAGQNLPNLFINIINEDKNEESLENTVLNEIKYVYHENTHSIQYFDFDKLSNFENNPLRVLQFKEEIIRQYNPDYYMANYELIFQEIEARERADKKLLELINNLKIHGFENLKEELKEKIIIEQSNYKKGIYKKKSLESDEKIDINNYIDELIKMYPEISNKYSNFFKQCEKMDGYEK